MFSAKFLRRLENALCDFLEARRNEGRYKSNLNAYFFRKMVKKIMLPNIHVHRRHQRVLFLPTTEQRADLASSGGQPLAKGVSKSRICEQGATRNDVVLKV